MQKLHLKHSFPSIASHSRSIKQHRVLFRYFIILLFYEAMCVNNAERITTKRMAKARWSWLVSSRGRLQFTIANSRLCILLYFYTKLRHRITCLRNKLHRNTSIRFKACLAIRLYFQQKTNTVSHHSSGFHINRHALLLPWCDTSLANNPTLILVWFPFQRQAPASITAFSWFKMIADVS